MTSAFIPILTKSYTFDHRPHSPFRIVGKRYWIGERGPHSDNSTHSDEEDRVTLVFLHGTACHKEHWEPMIQRLFEIQQTASRRTVQFHDMWSLDMPNHGDSAVLNEDILLQGFETYSWQDAARCFHAFLAGVGTGVDVDFSKRRLALVGHSSGGPVAIFATRYHPPLKIVSLHLFEPFLVADTEGSEDFSLIISNISANRRDIWRSSEEALHRLRIRPWSRQWDERTLKIVAEDGLRPLPTAEYPNLQEGVTLKCPRKQEAATHRDQESCSIAYRCLPYVLKEIPTHVTYGTVSDDFLPEVGQQRMRQVGSLLSSEFTTVTTVPGAGHAILQTHPETVAEIVWKSLIHDNSSKKYIESKL